METRYFGKELFSNKLTLSNGRRCPFVECGDDAGVLETTDPAIAAELDVCIAHHRSGVYVLTFEEYEALKKKPLVNRSSQTYPQNAQEMLLRLSRTRAEKNAAVTIKQVKDAAGKPAPVADPTPTLARVKTLKRTVPPPA